MIYVTGDTHGNIDITKFNTNHFPEQKSMTKNDYVIVCGDFGLIWDKEENNQERYWLKWIEDKNFTLLFIDGNHENFNRLNSYPVENWNGGKVHIISKNIIHLMRGEIYNLENKTFFTMGGAISIDKMYRTENVTWWEAESPTEQETDYAIENLKKVNNRVDYIITHCADEEALIQILNCRHNKNLEVIQTHFQSKKNPKTLESLFSYIKKNVEYKHWYFGHYHTNTDFFETHQTCLYYDILKID